MFNLKAIEMSLLYSVMVDVFIEAVVVLLVSVVIDFDELILLLYLDY